eukprot:TRINITY_DN341_c0_g1_i5.p1 TRINITY_DN341_c0_g1~~TRINITY_DN341_c0_g1_i5.p1  ORF type:complete len:980 (+),score=299.00 TRINITY_DN341_c0_g1_i5:4365-7304(+)
MDNEDDGMPPRCSRVGCGGMCLDTTEVHENPAEVESVFFGSIFLTTTTVSFFVFVSFLSPLLSTFFLLSPFCPFLFPFPFPLPLPFPFPLFLLFPPPPRCSCVSSSIFFVIFIFFSSFFSSFIGPVFPTLGFGVFHADILFSLNWIQSPIINSPNTNNMSSRKNSSRKRTRRDMTDNDEEEEEDETAMEAEAVQVHLASTLNSGKQSIPSRRKGMDPMDDNSSVSSSSDDEDADSFISYSTEDESDEEQEGESSAMGQSKQLQYDQHEDDEVDHEKVVNPLTFRHGFPDPKPDEDGTFTDSDEEEWANPPENRIGNIPIEWYDDMDHIGYDVHGNKIMKKEGKDALDTFIDRSDDPYDWRKVHDYVNDKDITLTDEEIELVNRLVAGKHADGSYDPYADYVDWFKWEDGIHPLSNAPEPKRRFQPSRHENRKVMRIVRGIRAGTVKTRAQWEAEQNQEKPLVLAWTEEETNSIQDDIMHIAAPKRALPTHAESYNPSAEFLPTEEEKEKWELMDPEDRPYNFMPNKHDALRHVPVYNNLIRENFDRCLDLYLCPRVKKRRMNVDPESLVPALPKAKDLKPFPTTLSIQYLGHSSKVRSISIHPTGQYLASGSEDHTVRLWEVATARCLRVWKFTREVDSPVEFNTIHCVKWNPNPNVFVLAVAVGQRVVLCNALVGSAEQNKTTDAFILGQTGDSKQEGEEGEGEKDEGDNDDNDDDEEEEEEPDLIEQEEEEHGKEKKKVPVVWKVLQIPRSKRRDTGKRIVLQHNKIVMDIAWHKRGDYFSTTAPKAQSTAVIVHQLSKRDSQNPFSKSLGLVQQTLFHPSKPIFFVATQHYVRVYNLVKQELVRKLMTGVKYVSSMHLHPGGDNIIVGSYDKRLVWFDLDLSSKPYRTLRYHSKAIRAVQFHPRYPLFASSSDDCKVHIFHGRVYNDLSMNPLIVPLKILRGHQEVSHVGVLDLEWHPTQPWIVTAGADGEINLYV